MAKKVAKEKRTRFEIAAAIISQKTYSEDSRLFQDVASALSLKLSGQMLEQLELLIAIKCDDAAADAIVHDRKDRRAAENKAKRETVKGRVDTDNRSKIEREYADEWAGSDCTLDGKPARIIGRVNKFGTVVLWQGTHTPGNTRADFSWSTINHIMTSGDKAFKS